MKIYHSHWSFVIETFCVLYEVGYETEDIALNRALYMEI